MTDTIHVGASSREINRWFTWEM